MIVVIVTTRNATATKTRDLDILTPMSMETVLSVGASLKSVSLFAPTNQTN